MDFPITRCTLPNAYSPPIPTDTASVSSEAIFGAIASSRRRLHKAGDKMYVNYAGDKLHLTLPDGTDKPVEVFVAVWGCSQLTYVEATESQRKEDFIGSCENALHYYGGVPLAVVTDNLRSAVTRASRYEAVLNDDFAAFGEHYGLVICPARGYKPKDKIPVTKLQIISLRYTAFRGAGRGGGGRRG